MFRALSCLKGLFKSKLRQNIYCKCTIELYAKYTGKLVYPASEPLECGGFEGLNTDVTGLGEAVRNEEGKGRDKASIGEKRREVKYHTEERKLNRGEKKWKNRTFQTELTLLITLCKISSSLCKNYLQRPITKVFEELLGRLGLPCIIGLVTLGQVLVFCNPWITPLTCIHHLGTPSLESSKSLAKTHVRLRGSGGTLITKNLSECF